MRKSAPCTILSERSIGPLPSSSISVKPRKRQKITMAGIHPSASAANGLDGMNRSVMLVSTVPAVSWVLKNEAASRKGNASWNEKNARVPIAQRRSRTSAAFTAMARALSLFRLPIPTMRETTTEGRMVICQTLMNASARGASAEQSSPKTSPVRTPRTRPSTIHVVRLRRGSLMVLSHLLAETIVRRGMRHRCDGSQGR